MPASRRGFLLVLHTAVSADHGSTTPNTNGHASEWASGFDGYIHSKTRERNFVAPEDLQFDTQAILVVQAWIRKHVVERISTLRTDLPPNTLLIPSSSGPASRELGTVISTGPRKAPRRRAAAHLLF